jgi:CheY-like chemotaxis protein
VHVLICDDDAGTRLLVKSVLVKRLGWTVEECADGAQALQALGRGGFDLAVLDINMPQLDGVSVVEAIRDSAELKQLPVVVLTSDQREEVVRRLIALGISDYIVKPLVLDVALAKFTRIGKSIRPERADLD